MIKYLFNKIYFIIKNIIFLILIFVIIESLSRGFIWIVTKDFKALKVWMTIKTYGKNKIINAIQNDIEITKYAYQIVTASNDFKAINKPELSIFCFQYIGKTNENKLNKLNKKIIELIEQDGRVFLSGTLINNTNVLRINCINHRRKKSDIDFLFKILRQLGEKASILIA